jgi:FixJ family two-component response regulator
MNPSSDSEIVYVVDDDVSYLRSVSRLIEAAGYSVKAFDSAEKFLDQLSPETRGCLLTDLRMPGLDGLDLQEELGGQASPLPVVFLSAQGDIPTTVQAMRAGAEDFLTKLCPKEKLLDAIRRALERGQRERAARDRLRELQTRFSALTPRELQVLERVVHGKLNKQIAEELGINERTVKLHRTNLTRRLQVQSVAELTRLVEECELFKRPRTATNP